MPVLHNRINQQELKAKLLADDTARTTISFYKYFEIIDVVSFRDAMYTALQQLQVYGRIYIATEGINAQVSLPTAHINTLKEYLNTIPSLTNLRLNVAVDDDGKAFWVLKIKIRTRIVADGITDPTFSMAQKGKYVNATQLHQMIADNNTVLVDMRNHYEYEVGHFNNAVQIPSDTFRDQLPMAAEMLQNNKHKNIVMYCTGGIRCEKASAYLLHQGYTNVYHLEGGIINYAQQAKQAGLTSEFVGKNFVFDNRLGERITPHIIATCHQCGSPADTHTNCANQACHTLFIQCEACAKIYQGCCTPKCQATSNLPQMQQAILRKNTEKAAHSFNKSKARLRPKLGG